MNIDLSTKQHSMTHIIESNLSVINACKSTNELYSTLVRIFSDNCLDTEASNRLLRNVQLKKNFAFALQTVYDSLLCGSKLSVNQK